MDRTTVRCVEAGNDIDAGRFARSVRSDQAKNLARCQTETQTVKGPETAELLLQSAKIFGAVKAYGRSKLCNILFTRELARRLHGTGVTANCLHPGFVATRFGDQSGGLHSRFVWLAKFFAISPVEGAETIIYLASSPNVAKTTGQYFYKSVPTTSSSWAQDDRSALLLWQRSAALAGMKE